MFVFKAAVVGAGTMGGEIAHVIANADIPVVLKDVEQRFVDQGLEKARSLWQARVDAGKLTEEELQRKLGLISGATSYELLGDVDFVIEAVPERIEIKQAVFGELDEVTPGHAILASNTSSLSVTEMAQATGRPDQVVGLHFFYPASIMRLIEVIEGEDTSPETVQAAMNFAQAIRKTPIRCGEAPGFVVNRILNSSASELWRFQEETGIDVKELDQVVSQSRAAPVGPFYLADLLGLDTVVHVAEYLHECYGESFFVHERMRQLVAEGKLGAKTGEGFYEHGAEAGTGTEDGSRSMAAELDTAALVERFTLKALVEACLVLEEGVASMKDIDLGMMAGAGIIPPPFARADQVGLDEVLARLERAAGEWGERFAPPNLLRRLVAQGRLGVKSGQGFFPYARPDDGWDAGSVKLETRGSTAIAWLDRPPANAIAADVMHALRRLWDQVTGDGPVRALIIASANPMVFSAGSDIKAFTTMDAAAGKEHVNTMHALLREMETSQVVTIAAVNAIALGGGCELAMACDIRIAAESASFGQPEIKLGIIPGSGGTQRLPRLVGEGRALELNLTGDPIGAEEAYALGLATRVVPDEELFDTALAWARKLSEQAPLAVEQIKQVSAAADIESGIEREKQGFARVFSSADAREGISAFLEKRPPRFSGK